MNEDATSRILPLSLLVVVCLVGSCFARAQQSSGGANSGTYSSFAPASPTAGESQTPGLYSSDSSVLRGESLLGMARRMGLENSNSTNVNSANTGLTSKISARSAWLAGSSTVGGANLTGWKAGSTGFGIHSAGASWIAGAESFGLGRQDGGIWRAVPASGVDSLTAAPATGVSSLPSIAAGAPRFSTGLTAKGAGLVRSGAFSSRSTNHQGASSRFGASGAGALGTRSTFGGRQSPFASHSGRFGSGASGGSSSTHSGTSTGTLGGPSLNDPLQSNGDLELPDTLEPGTDNSKSGLSH